MKPNIVWGAVLAGVLVSAPALAEQNRRRPQGDPGRRTEQSARESDRRGDRVERAVPRAREDSRRDEVRREEARRDEVRRQEARRDEVRREDARREEIRREEARRDAARRAEVQRAVPRRDPLPRYDNRGRDEHRPPRYDPRSPREVRGRPFYWYSHRGGWGSRTIIVPRYVRPRVVHIAPYRPYIYRPSIAMGVYYGSGGYYPYGYTPRYYYDPTPGRPYGGLRITGFPRDAQVFADGYYVGIVNDFDGIFQHLNLEAGPHRIEIAGYGFEPIVFDVIIQPGRTVTFRADGYNY